MAVSRIFPAVCLLLLGAAALAYVSLFSVSSTPATGPVSVAHQAFGPKDLQSVESVTALFLRWRALHGKPEIENSEFEHRLAVFAANARKVLAHNSRKGISYTLGLNEFADLTTREFLSQRTGYRNEDADVSNRQLSMKGVKVPEDYKTQFPHGAAAEVPKALDWREHGVVSEVKNQGQCGSCWAFSATGAIESLTKIVTGNMTTLSEQELLDCDILDVGCNGGLPTRAFTWIVLNRGVDTEGDYAYSAADGKCDIQKRKTRVSKIQGYIRVPPSEWFLQRAVAHQPVSVGINADPLHLYAGGIIDSGCDGQLDHAVLVVGYGSEGGSDYWLVKNSWGTKWGERGYFRLKRTVEKQGGTCGIVEDASFPFVFHKGNADQLATTSD